MVKILTFEEWVLKLYDFNGDGKINRDGRGEYTAYTRALNNKNYAATQNAYAQYVALAEAANKNEREAELQQQAIEQQQQLVEMAGQGNEAARNILTGETKEGTAKTIILYIVAGVALVFFLLKRK